MSVVATLVLGDVSALHSIVCDGEIFSAAAAEAKKVSKFSASVASLCHKVELFTWYKCQEHTL